MIVANMKVIAMWWVVPKEETERSRQTSSAVGANISERIPVDQRIAWFARNCVAEQCTKLVAV